MSLVSGPGRGGMMATPELPDEMKLYIDKHVRYIQSLDTVCPPSPPFCLCSTLTGTIQRRDEIEYWLTEHLRLNGIYWGLTALHLLGHPEALPRNETIAFVLSCQHDSGGFGAAPGHDAHMLYTVSAIQILATIDALDDLEKNGRGGKEKVANCTLGLLGTNSIHTDRLFSHCKFARSDNRLFRRR